MGADIHGWVEVRYEYLDEFDGLNIWYAIIKAGQLLDRDYDAFGMLFGVRNRAGFVPVANHRGLPADASDEVREHGTPPEDAGEDDWICYHSPTWITYAEIKAINWDESALDKPLTRRVALEDSFQMVFEMMEALAKRVGDNNVRLVIRFDN